MKVTSAALDVGQEGVLLRLVEAVHLVDEEDGVAARARERGFGGLHRLADVLHAGEDRRERDELGVEAPCAMRRARVVLPEPGGPHRIIECGLPDSKASRNGLPGPSRCCWPTTSSSDCGRSALGERRPGLRRLKKITHFSPRTSAPFGGSKRNSVASTFGLRDDLREAQHGGLAEVVDELHRLERALGPEADAHALEAGLAARAASPRSHSRPSRLPASDSSNAFATSADPASSAAGVEPSAARELAHRDLVQVRGRRSRRARRRRR